MGVEGSNVHVSQDSPAEGISVVQNHHEETCFDFWTVQSNFQHKNYSQVFDGHLVVGRISTMKKFLR